MNQTGKRVLVTGATGGIGGALCAELANRGYSLVLAARNEDKLKSSCKALGSGHSYLTVDMANSKSVSEFSAKLEAAAPRLDGMVVMPPQIPPTNDCLPSTDTWRAIFESSFIGPLEVLKAAVARMKPDVAGGNRAKIVVISGISSAQVLGHYATSNVLRCAWLAEAKTLAFALADRGIHVNTVSLGGTLTDGYREKLAGRAASANMTFDQRLAEETSNIPLKKYGTPKEVAVVVSDLLGPFTDHITGHNLLCDGGFTRSY